MVILFNVQYDQIEITAPEIKLNQMENNSIIIDKRTYRFIAIGENQSKTKEIIQTDSANFISQKLLSVADFNPQFAYDAIRIMYKYAESKKKGIIGFIQTIFNLNDVEIQFTEYNKIEPELRISFEKLINKGFPAHSFKINGNNIKK